MKDFDRLISRWRQFGGVRLVWEYAKMGVLWIGVKEIVGCILHGRSFKTVYPRVTTLVDKLLINKYETEMKLLRNASDAARYENNSQSDKVWFCWLQGMDEAPELVRACLESIKRNVTENVVVVDERNYTEYVALPDYVVEKYRKGRIPGALFSDMLRLELLIKYGGTWIDSTVLATERGSDAKPSWQEITDSELFIYRYYRKGRVVGISNWFIHAKKGNMLLRDLRDMLYAYWRDYDCTVEYYIFHLFFRVVARRYPEMIAKMPKGNSYHALLLRDRIDQPFDKVWWEKLKANVPFHKLNYRKVPNNASGTFYEYIIKGED